MALHRGVLVAYDGAMATVKLDAAPSQPLSGVRTSRIPAGEYVPGRRVLVEVDDSGDPMEAVVVAVWS